MALTASSMVSLGTSAPPFSLTDVIDGSRISFDSIAGKKGTLVMFLCNHCPYVKHIAGQVGLFSADYHGKGIGIVAISSNDARTYPQDSPQFLKEIATAHDWKFPFLYDETQQVAKAYQATCTPDFFLYNDKVQLAYRGQFDDSRPGNNEPVTGKDLRAAMDALLNGQPVPAQQKPSIGCNIKWKDGY